MRAPLCLLAGSFLLGALAAIPGAHAETDPFRGDSRLDRKVTVRAEGIAVGALLPRITRACGVPLTVDAETSDEKVMVFGPARPLRELLDDLAALMGGRWEDTPPGPYRLVKDPAVRKLQDELVRGPERRMMAQMDAQARALRESRRQVEARPAGDPLRERLLDPKARFGTQAYALLSLEQRRRLFERGHLRVFFTDLRPELQAVFLEGLRKAEAEAEAVIIRGMQYARARRRNPPDLYFDLNRPSSFRRREGKGKAHLRVFPGADHVAALEDSVQFPPVRGNPYTGEPVPRAAVLPRPGPADPTLEWCDRLRAFSERSGAPVLADYSRLRVRPPVGGEPAEGDGPAAELDRFCREAGALWWTRGKAVLFRHRDWFLRRLYEPPDRWLDATLAALRSRGDAVTIGDILRLDDLTWRQQLGVMALGSDWGAFPGAFRFYEERWIGLPELLEMLNGRSGGAGLRNVKVLDYRAIDEVEARNRGYEAMTLRFERMTPNQRKLIVPFLAAQRGDLDGLQVETFTVTFNAGEPTSHKKQIRHVPIEIEWRLRGGRGRYEGLFLPLTIPNDRRERTLVEPAG